VTSAAKTLGLYQASISLYLKEKRTKPFKGKYIFKLITKNQIIEVISGLKKMIYINLVI